MGDRVRGEGVIRGPLMVFPCWVASRSTWNRRSRDTCSASQMLTNRLSLCRPSLRYRMQDVLLEMKAAAVEILSVSLDLV